LAQPPEVAAEAVALFLAAAAARRPATDIATDIDRFGGCFSWPSTS
jgi:hypothetical protein